MNLEIYNTKFNKIKDFEFLVPNISLALEVLANLHEEKKNLVSCFMILLTKHLMNIVLIV